MTAALHLRRPASSRDWGNEMRKVILQMMITLDGLIAGPNDELDWIDNDPVMGEAHFALAEGADAALIGHNVYQSTAAHWPRTAANHDAPSNEGEFGKLTNRMPKSVVSARPEKRTWENCEQLLVKDDRDVCPIALGAGKPLFPQRTPLKFVSVTPYRSGAMTVSYEAT